MKIRGVMAIACLGVLLVANFGVASASAEAPAWWECAKQTGGPFEKGCGKEGGAAGWVLRPGIGKGKTFSGTGGPVQWHRVLPGGVDIVGSCTSWKVTGGVAVPNKVTNVVLTLKKCRVSNSRCITEGLGLDEILSEPLAGELGWLKKPGSAGLALYNQAAPKTGLIANFNCEGEYLQRWFGALIGEEGPVGSVGKEFTTNFAVSNYLGEVEPLYQPLTNPPAFEEGEVGVLEAQINSPATENAWWPEGGMPIGLEGSLASKGEALAIK
jgi:hypothetical protein